jgi:hypothetical protein
VLGQQVVVLHPWPTVGADGQSSFGGGVAAAAARMLSEVVRRPEVARLEGWNTRVQPVHLALTTAHQWRTDGPGAPTSEAAVT